MCGIFIGNSMFGMLEMVVTPGQITVPIMWIMLYFAGLESYSKSCRGKNIEKEQNRGIRTELKLFEFRFRLLFF